MITNIKQLIIAHAKEIGTKFDSKGYVASPGKNLILNFPNWNVIQVEIKNGKGNELKTYKKKPKFCAVHSSSCLCVNNFAKIKELGGKINFLSLGRFDNINFEGAVSTGISTPNLDVLLENDDIICGVESKFTEIYSSKLPDTRGNLSKYKKRINQLINIPVGFEKTILDFYIQKPRMHLDVAQLIKHSLGLINSAKKKGKYPVLLYIYFQPKEPTEPDFLHKKELAEFTKRISKFIEFKSMSYRDFWSYYKENSKLKEVVKLNMLRYEI
nr:hypothetical protein [uncultured Treponema sp.]